MTKNTKRKSGPPYSSPRGERVYAAWDEVVKGLPKIPGSPTERHSVDFFNSDAVQACDPGQGVHKKSTLTTAPTPMISSRPQGP